jgi:NitT/TauT family transport system substrate-binding protein
MLVALLFIAACQPAASETADSAPIRIGAERWVGFTPLYIADQQGFFEQAGVDVEFVLTDNTEQTRQMLINRELELGTSLTFDTLAQAAAGIPMQVVWLFDTSVGGDVIVGDASIATPADLAGKTIGLRFGSFSHAFVLASLAQYNLSADDITIVNLNEDQVPAALADGTIDAGHTWEPYLSEATANGEQVILTSTEVPGVIMDSLAAHSHTLEERSDEVQRVIEALTQANVWWQANPTEGNAIAAEIMGLPATEIEAILTGLDIYDGAENRALFSAETDAPWLALEGIVPNFVEAGVLREVPDFSTVFNGSFVIGLDVSAVGG